MGSIADLLGDQLRAGLAQMVDPASRDGACEDAPASLDLAPGESRSAGERAREIAMEAVLNESGLEPAKARGELTLRGDLDMDDVSLYAVVARIEREAKLRITDAQIDSAVSLKDLLDAVETTSLHE